MSFRFVQQRYRREELRPSEEGARWKPPRQLRGAGSRAHQERRS
jgi:hypothetical protein